MGFISFSFSETSKHKQWSNGLSKALKNICVFRVLGSKNIIFFLYCQSLERKSSKNGKSQYTLFCSFPVVILPLWTIENIQKIIRTKKNYMEDKKVHFIKIAA